MKSLFMGRGNNPSSPAPDTHVSKRAPWGKFLVIACSSALFSCSAMSSQHSHIWPVKTAPEIVENCRTGEKCDNEGLSSVITYPGPVDSKVREEAFGILQGQLSSQDCSIKKSTAFVFSDFITRAQLPEHRERATNLLKKYVERDIYTCGNADYTRYFLLGLQRSGYTDDKNWFAQRTVDFLELAPEKILWSDLPGSIAAIACDRDTAPSLKNRIYDVLEKRFSSSQPSVRMFAALIVADILQLGAAGFEMNGKLLNFLERARLDPDLQVQSLVSYTYMAVIDPCILKTGCNVSRRSLVAALIRTGDYERLASLAADNSAPLIERSEILDHLLGKTAQGIGGEGIMTSVVNIFSSTDSSEFRKKIVAMLGSVFLDGTYKKFPNFLTSVFYIGTDPKTDNLMCKDIIHILERISIEGTDQERESAVASLGNILNGKDNLVRDLQKEVLGVLGRSLQDPSDKVKWQSMMSLVAAKWQGHLPLDIRMNAHLLLVRSRWAQKKFRTY